MPPMDLVRSLAEKHTRLSIPPPITNIETNYVSSGLTFREVRQSALASPFSNVV